tara:strand:+ start:51 stop:1436 length:1386 start_codon:yes stop_codon:yes gene_type:complete
MANSYATHSATTPTNAKKFTISFWAKRAKLNADQQILGFETDSNNKLYCWFNASNQFDFINKSSNSTTMRLKTTKTFLDTAAWYHILLAVDTTDNTSTDRLKLYVNGSRHLSANNGYASETYPSADATASVGGTHIIGADHNGGSQQYFYEGALTHIHYTDGYVYTPSTFGETDSTSGIWKPKPAPSGVTYGTNGFFLKFENNAALGTDSSGQSNTFTASGNLKQLQDTPSNSYANLSPLYTIEYNSAHFFTNQNNTTNENQTQWNTNPCTHAVSKGKWYFEGYGHTNGNNYVHYGITSQAKMNANATQAQQEIQAQSNGYAEGYYGNNGNRYYSTTSASTSTSYGASYGSSDYIGIFLDLDNNKLYFAKNGTLQNSGTGLDVNAAGKPYLLATAVYNGLTNVNFGNGLFGTTALTGTTYADANGHGIFKYSPNQGGAANFDSTAKNFYAMNTKNLEEFGG